MRIFFSLIFLAVFSLLPEATYAQRLRGVCGTHPDATIERLIKNKAAVADGMIQTRGAVEYAPVKYHLVALSDGSGRVTEENVLKMHCYLNELYAPFDVQFYIKDGFSYLDNDVVYNNHLNTQGTIMNPRRDAKAINVWIVKDATPGSGTIGTTLGYYSPQRDWVVIRIDEVTGKSSTLPHEMGHYFSLAHPHRGYDSDPFTSDDPGWPKAPLISPGGVPTEKMDGSNCTTAGDMLCDTPPDYNFGFGWSGCNYNGGAQDPNGIIVDPDESLIMSYFLDNCTDRFSDEQIDLIRADLRSRNELNNSFSPAATTVTADGFTPIYPKDEEVIAYRPKVTLDWEDHPGATLYLVEVSNTNFFFTKSTFFVNTSSVEVGGLDPNKSYYWRVKPINEFYTCTNTTPPFKFTLSTTIATADIPFVESFTVSPNPIKEAQRLYVQLQSERQFEARLRILNLTGQILTSRSQAFTSGTNRIGIEVGDFAPGMYLLSLQSESGNLLTKFVINR